MNAMIPFIIMSTAARDLWQPMLEGFVRLRSKWPRRGWSWDNRLNCVTSSINADLEAEARLVALEGLPSEWTHASIASAPPRVRDLADRSGGLRAGQLLYSAGPVAGVLAYGLWWPWGDGVTISLRIGLDIGVLDEPYARFREIFGVEL
ncbi:MAG TPA: hypothetical protein VNO21_04865 [Polyangiaceae bacterium]|nr:hypothetical protein [Polyangiaceae bacterium]